jgi:hypothetical protein
MTKQAVEVTVDEVRLFLYEKLFHEYQGENVESPRAFVGLQGDKVVLMQTGGEPLVVLVKTAVMA